VPFEDWKEGSGAGVPAFESTKTPRKFSSDFIETARATQKNGTDQIYWIRLRILDLTELAEVHRSLPFKWCGDLQRCTFIPKV
jgi:hypothetical protein